MFRFRKAARILAAAGAVGAVVATPAVASAGAPGSVSPNAQIVNCLGAQIDLALQNGGQVCVGGGIGAVRIPFLPTRGLYSGNFWGYATCSNGKQVFFTPAE